VNGVQGKFTEFRHFMITNPKVSIVGVVESHLLDDSSLQNIEIENFELIRSNRARQGGGLLLYISTKFAMTEFLHPINFPFESEIIAVNLITKGIKPIVIVLIYKPPHVKCS